MQYILGYIEYKPIWLIAMKNWLQSSILNQITFWATSEIATKTYSKLYLKLANKVSFKCFPKQKTLFTFLNCKLLPSTEKAFAFTSDLSYYTIFK